MPGSVSELVDLLLAQRPGLNPAIVQAFRVVRRHLFVPGVFQEAVYRDVPIVTRRDADGLPLSRSNRPSVMATMLDELRLQPGLRVLEIGTGTGYNAGLLAEVVGTTGEVSSVELDEETAESARAHLNRAGYGRVQVITGDGAEGHTANAPYDRVIVTAAAWDIAPAWVAQLKPGGILVLSLTTFGLQIGAALQKQPDGSLTSIRIFPVDQIALQGALAGPEYHIRVPGEPMRIDFLSHEELDAAQVRTLLSADDHGYDQFPATLDRNGLGMVSYYLLFHRPAGYEFITYTVEDGQMAFGLQGIGWGLLSGVSACLVPYGDQRVIHTFGGGEAGYLLSELAEKWQAEGRPTPERFHLAVVPASQSPADPVPPGTSQTATRPNYHFRLWIAAETS